MDVSVSPLWHALVALALLLVWAGTLALRRAVRKAGDDIIEAIFHMRGDGGKTAQ